MPLPMFGKSHKSPADIVKNLKDALTLIEKGDKKMDRAVEEMSRAFALPKTPKGSGSRAFALPKTPKGPSVPGSSTRPSLGRLSLVDIPQSAQRSSYLRSSSAGFKDRRNVMNQEFKNRMINKILEFCSDYPEVTRDKVRAPSQRDFIMIFELIYTTFDPKYTLENKKLGEEIPSLLRNWGYPIPIKPSTLLTVGAPTAWPHLLAMLGWMIDMASVHQKLSLESAFLESNNTDEFFKSMTYALEARKFKQYSKDRQSADNDPNFFSDVKTIFAQQCEQSRGTAMQLEECKKNVKQLMEEIEAFKAEGDACRSLKDQKSQLEQDVTKCREYFMELESEVNGKRERCVLFDKVAREKEQELNAAKKKMQELEAAMTAQTTESGIDAATAREMRMEKQQNKTKLEQLTLGIEEVYKKKYALVIEAKKRFSAIQGPVKRRLQRVLQVRQELLGEHNQQELVGLQAEDARSLHEVVTEKGKRLIYKTRSDLETLALQIASSLKKVEAECRQTLEEIGVEKEREHCERREEDAREKLREKERLKWQRERALLERESDACRADINATLELQQDIGNMRNTIESARQDLEETVNRINREKAAVEGEVSDKMAEIILEWEESKRKLEMVEQETDRMFLSQDIE